MAPFYALFLDFIVLLGLRRVRDDPAAERPDGADVHERYAKIAGGGARGPGGDTYYGYRDDLYNEVAESFARPGVPVPSATSS